MLCGSRAARRQPHLPPEPEAFYRGEPARKRAQDRDRGGSEGVWRGREPFPGLEGDVASAPKTAAILRAEPVPRVGGPPPPPAPQRLRHHPFSTGVLPQSPKPDFRGPDRGYQAAPQLPGTHQVPCSPPPASLPTLVLRSPGPECLSSPAGRSALTFTSRNCGRRPILGLAPSASWMPGSLRHPRAENGRLRSPVGGRSPGPLRCSQTLGFALSRPAPPVGSGSPFASKSGRRLPTQSDPPPPHSRLEPASPCLLPHGPPAARLGSPPPRLASPSLSSSPPLSSSPSSAPRPSSGCWLPPPRSAAQPRAGFLRPGVVDPPLSASRLAAVRGARRQRWRPPQLWENQGSGRRRRESNQCLSSSLLCGWRSGPREFGGLGGLAGFWGI